MTAGQDGTLGTMRGVVLLALVACGRIGYEPRLDNGAADATSDTTSDTPGADCPPGTLRFTSPPAVVEAFACIETAERGNATWTEAREQCTAAGRRLCTDAEWFAACEELPGLVDMAGDGNWEWVADEDAGVAQKRGVDVCGDTSAHEIFVDPYDFRCCVDL